MAVTTAQVGQALAMQAFKQGTSGQPAGKKFVAEQASPFAHSTGTTISLARTMFKRLRAAASIARGSELSF
jgi:hypothetical protein